MSSITPQRKVFGEPNSSDHLKSLHDTYKNIERGYTPQSGASEHIRKCKNIHKDTRPTTIEEYKRFKTDCENVIKSTNDVIYKIKNLDSLTGHVKKDKQGDPIMVPQMDNNGNVVKNENGEPQLTTIPRHTMKIDQFYEIIKDCQKEINKAQKEINRLNDMQLHAEDDDVRKKLRFRQDIRDFLLSACS
jgi:hypothetical protein